MIRFVVNTVTIITLTGMCLSGCLIPSGVVIDQPPAEAEAMAVKQIATLQTAEVQESKAKAAKIIQKSSKLRIREYLQLGDQARMGVLLAGYDYLGAEQPAGREEVLVETHKKDSPGTFFCPMMSKAYSRGGDMSYCTAHYLYNWYNTDTETAVSNGKKFYNKALDMDPNNVQALVGLANLYLIQAVGAHYERDRLRLELENLLMGLRPRGEARKNPLDMTVSQLLAVIRPSETPDENTKVAIRRFLWEGTSLRHLITYYLRTSKARCQDALRVNGQFAPAHLGLALSAAVAQDWKAALATLTFIEINKLEIPRKRSMFFVWKGFVLEQIGDVDEAIKAYSKAIEIDEPYQFMEFPRSRLQSILLSRQPS
jgi:tetratricopeptide (TPR) repeat protein